MKNEPDFDLETQRLLDIVCEGVEVSTEEFCPVDDLEDDLEDSVDDGYGSYADEAWHDAQEYPEW
jgi:hypothetical protein